METNTELAAKKTILLDFEKPIEKLQAKVDALIQGPSNTSAQKTNLKKQQDALQVELKKIFSHLTHWQKTQVARHPDRPYALDYLAHIASNFTELHGDRRFGDDPALVCGIGKIGNFKVAVVAHQKDRLEPIKRNFGMANPEGYRKALRVMELAEKFGLPIITMIDTPGAFPGKGGEERGQAEAIATNLRVMSALKVPIICIVTGEGGSGGALGIGVGDRIFMLEHAVYSVISPESFASIIWRDAALKEKGAEALKHDAKTALKFKLIDGIIPEPIGGAHRDHVAMAAAVEKTILKELVTLSKMSVTKLLAERRKKFAQMGVYKKS